MKTGDATALIVANVAATVWPDWMAMIGTSCKPTSVLVTVNCAAAPCAMLWT